MKVIKNYIASLPYTSKDIILFNYPSSDLREQNSDEFFYPRAADELHSIENALGYLKIFLDISWKPMNTEITDKVIPRVIEEVEVVQKNVKKEGEEEEEDEPNEEEDEEEKKKPKFNPNDYDWTDSNGIPKSLAQVFNKLKSEIHRVSPAPNPQEKIDVDPNNFSVLD